MEKKKSNKLIIVLVIVLILIILGLVGYIVYDKVVYEKTLTINEKSDSKKTTAKTSSDSDSDVMSDEDALSLGNLMWTYTMNAIWGDETVWTRHSNGMSTPISCDTTRDEVVKKFASDFKGYYSVKDSENPVSINELIPEDTTCSTVGGRGSNSNYAGTTLKVKTVSENKIVFTATSTYNSDAWCAYYGLSDEECKEAQSSEGTEDSSETYTNDFVIVKENDEWLIQEFHMPN